jgi:hypothetical protein
MEKTMVNVKGVGAYNAVASLQSTAVRIDTSLNYTAHEIKVKDLLKEIHVLLLSKDFVAAAATIDQTIVELRLMRAAIKSHVKE